jgi:hypothetical protein
VDIARRSRDAVFKHDEARELLKQPGKAEASFLVWDAEYEVRRKIRVDWLITDRNAPIVDVKTTGKGVKKSGVRSAVYMHGYHVQDAFYTDTLAMHEGAFRPDYKLIFVTKARPFMARVYKLNECQEDVSLYKKGQDIYLERLAKFAMAWHNRQWSAYEHEEAVLLTTLS